MIRAGKFHADLDGPYPVWIAIRHEDRSCEIRITHSELSDLHYVIEKAMQKARIKLGANKDEV